MIIERLELEEHPVIHLSLHPFFLGREPPSIPMFTLSLIVNSFTLVFLCVFILSTIFCALLCCFFGNDFCIFHSSTASKYASSYFFFAFPASQLSDITCDTVCRVLLFCFFFVAAVVAVAVAVAVVECRCAGAGWVRWGEGLLCRSRCWCMLRRQPQRLRSGVECRCHLTG